MLPISARVSKSEQNSTPHYEAQARFGVRTRSTRRKGCRQNDSNRYTQLKIHTSLNNCYSDTAHGTYTRVCSYGLFYGFPFHQCERAISRCVTGKCELYLECPLAVHPHQWWNNDTWWQDLKLQKTETISYSELILSMRDIFSVLTMKTTRYAS